MQPSKSLQPKTREAIRKIILKAGVYQVNCARHISVSQAHFCRMMAGKRHWSWNNLALVAEFCRASAEDIQKLLKIWAGEELS